MIYFIVTIGKEYDSMMIAYYQLDESKLTIALMEKVFMTEKARSLVQGISNGKNPGSFTQEKALSLTSKNICHRCGLMGHEQETCRSPEWRVKQFKDSGYNPNLFSKKNKQIMRQRLKSNNKKKRRNQGQDSSAIAQETILTTNDKNSHTHPIMPKPIPKKRMKNQMKEETLLIVGPQNGKDKVNLYLDSGATCHIFKKAKFLSNKPQNVM